MDLGNPNSPIQAQRNLDFQSQSGKKTSSPAYQALATERPQSMGPASGPELPLWEKKLSLRLGHHDSRLLFSVHFSCSVKWA
jgi:hypothetical protein